MAAAANAGALLTVGLLLTVHLAVAVRQALNDSALSANPDLIAAGLLGGNPVQGLLGGGGDANRPNIQPQQIGSSKSWSPWELDMQGLSCQQLDLAPFKYLDRHWPICAQEAQAAATKLSRKYNCRICDISLSGSKPERDQGWKSTKCKAKVTCAGSRIDLKEACFPNNGEVGKIAGLNQGSKDRAKWPGKECLPCPFGCKFCAADSSSANWAKGKATHYKCIISPVENAQGWKRCELPVGVEGCGQCKNRNCRGETALSTLLGYDRCETSDFKATCKFRTEWDLPASDSVSDAFRNYQIKMGAGRSSRAIPEAMQYMVNPEFQQSA